MKLYGLFSITPKIGNNVSYATHVTDAVIPYMTRYGCPYLSAYIRLCIRKGISLPNSSLVKVLLYTLLIFVM